MAVQDPSFPSVSKWAVELPHVEAKDSDFGGCRSIEKNYQRDTQIGEGTYGEVYLGHCTATGEKVALKKIRMDNEKEGFPITSIREIKLLKTLSDDNVITLKEIVRSQAHSINNMKGSIYMVLDYMDHDLTGLMERCNYKMEISHIKCYMKQLLRGLNYCHAKKILHRDLKASNLLIDNKGCLKIADFGLARSKEPDANNKGRLTNRVITLWYRPPELVLGATEYGPEIDIWSVGCIFAELLAGQPLFPGKDEADQLERICKVMGAPTEQTMPGVSKLAHYHMVDKRFKENRLKKHLQSKRITDTYALDLLSKLLEMDPKKRITALAAADHEYFWTDPKPARREDLPRYAASHELDMKKLRQDAKHKHRGSAQSQPEAKRARHMEAQHAGLPRPHDHHQTRSGHHHDSRAPPAGGHRQMGSGHRDHWDGRGGGGISVGQPHEAGRGYPDQPPLPQGAYPPPGFGGHYAGGQYGAPPPGLSGHGPQPLRPPGFYQQGSSSALGPAYDATGYPVQGHPGSQAHRGNAPVQQELGAPPGWTKWKR